MAKNKRKVQAFNVRLYLDGKKVKLGFVMGTVQRSHDVIEWEEVTREKRKKLAKLLHATLIDKER
jgi:hypothetical protein